MPAKLRVSDQASAPSPSQEIVDEAKKVVKLTTPAGRAISIQKPGVLSQFRLIEMVGGETAQNQVYMAMALPLFWVVELDGEKVYQPKTKRELEALIQRVEEDGISTVVDGITEHFDSVGDDDVGESAKNE